MSESIDKGLDWARRFRMNLDPMQEVGFDGELMVFVRLRPWKQDAKYPVMYVGAGSTFEKACRAAMEHAISGESRPLRWEWRPWSGTENGRAFEPTAEDLPF